MVQQPWVEIIILTLIGLLEIALAVYVLVTYQKTASIVVFALLTFCISGWVLSSGPVLFLQPGSEMFDIVARSAFLFVMLLFCLLYLFVLLHPYPTLDIHKRFIFILFLPVIFFTLLLYGSNSLVVGFANSRYGDTFYGASFWVYSLYIFFMYLLALVELRLRAKGLDDLHRWQMNMLFFALIASGGDRVYKSPHPSILLSSSSPNRHWSRCIAYLACVDVLGGEEKEVNIRDEMFSVSICQLVLRRVGG